MEMTADPKKRLSAMQKRGIISRGESRRVEFLQAATVSRGAISCQKTLAARGSWKIVTYFPLSGGPTVAHFCIHATATRRSPVVNFWGQSDTAICRQGRDMIRDLDIRLGSGEVLVGIALGDAVLDIRTSVKQLRTCCEMMNSEHVGLVEVPFGDFGGWSVTLNVHTAEACSIFIDGPCFEPGRNLSAGIYLSKRDVMRVIEAALEKVS